MGIQRKSTDGRFILSFRVGVEMKTLYLDCFSGISGDMMIGALIDAGGDYHYLTKELKKLKIEDEYELKIEKVVKNGISATKFDVILTHTLSKPKGDDHSHAHHHEQSHSEENEQEHTHHYHVAQEHHSNHGHSHHHAHHHAHRTFTSIVHLIEESTLSAFVKETAIKVFRLIGEAEAKIHGVSIENVHFHEVGAVDSIIDIVGTAILLEYLQIEKVVSSPVPVGTGHIHIDHGVYPVPAPATLEILKGIPLQKSSLKGELTTPTGAAFLKALVDCFSVLPSMVIEKVGYGAGSKNYSDHPNVLRVMIGSQ